ncbi:MAG: EVE domain-containing protein [Gammaproteobacteria bacterium]|nr:EVE domain-containing protein [Gammaproteobacteria bacterium]NNF60079.1 EVE domain-containing protein [Gammaproteobacteria bacterium]NNM21158.1 EVE domain-containing protein [Gammaproteobacteria bacterium]
MKYWLLKSEPGSYSIDDLAAEKNKTACWDGVRNYQARNMMQEMKKGDLCFFYHSSCPEPGIVGIVKVVREAYPDHTAFDPEDHHYDPKSDPDDPRWFMVDVRIVRKFAQIIGLRELREHADGALSDMVILRRGNRLSVTPVTKKQWNFITSMQ